MKNPRLLLSASVFAFGLSLSSCTVKSSASLHSTTPGTSQSSGEITLTLRTAKASYRAGETVKLTVGSTHSCAVEIWSEDALGNRTWVREPGGAQNWTVRAGESLNLPPARAAWKIVAGAPFGTNLLVAKVVSFNGGGGSSDTKGLVIWGNASGAEGEARWLYEVKAR